MCDNITSAPNIHVRSEDKFPPASKFTSVLSNSSNKIRLQQFIETLLGDYSCMHNKEIIVCTGSDTRNLLTKERVEDYAVHQAEADTAIFTIYHKTIFLHYWLFIASRRTLIPLEANKSPLNFTLVTLKTIRKA